MYWHSFGIVNINPIFTLPASKKNIMAKKSKVVKKVLAKKAAPKKAIAKKAVAKKAVAKKPVTKKAPVKKVAPKKVVAKKPPVKKAAPKKAAPKKAAVKKVTPKKIAPPKRVIAKQAPVKAVTKPAQPVVSKKAVAKPVAKPAVVSLTPASELSEELVEKAANTSKQMMIPGDGLNEAPPVTEDPVQAFDKNTFNKATAKGDPHSKLHLSSKPKNAIKPSGKKPLW